MEPLIQALKDEDNSVRVEAAKALLMMPDSAIELLIQILKSEEDADFRQSVVKALELFVGDERVVDPFIQALKGEICEIRKIAMGALEKIGGENFGTLHTGTKG